MYFKVFNKIENKICLFMLHNITERKKSFAIKSENFQIKLWKLF